MNKHDLVQHLNALLNDRADSLRAEITATRHTFTDDTKSSAGDKHEVGRAMTQQELDKLEDRLAKLTAQQQELARVPLERVFDRAAFGSLVHTDAGTYFLAIGLGHTGMDGQACFAVSIASPIGQVLLGKRSGERVEFNGRSFTVVEVR